MAMPPTARAERCDLIEELAAAHEARRRLEGELGRLKDQNAALMEACVAAEAVNQARGQFISGMEDEIRTPLNGLIGMSGILAQTRLDPNQIQISRAIETSARSLNTLLLDMLELAALDTGPLDLDLAPFSLHDTVADLEDRYTPEMARKGLGFEVRTSARAGAAGEIVGDGPRVSQAIGRLLRQALKSTDRGQVILDIDVSGHGELIFTVTGADGGVDLNQPARRLHGRAPEAGRSEPRREQAGLGLAIGRALLEAMGGTLSVDVRAQQGDGAVAVRFTACLPLVRREAKAA